MTKLPSKIVADAHQANIGPTHGDADQGHTDTVPQRTIKLKSNQLSRLASIRAATGQTQQYLAEKIGTTQQTIARWENGTTEPSLTQLRDLAVCFGISVADLLGDIDHIASSNYKLKTPLVSGFWGHVGVRLPGASLSKWYPITAVECNYIVNASLRMDDGNQWVIIDTLANRQLACNMKHIQFLRLLDDDADFPQDDWDRAHIHDQNAKEVFLAAASLLDDDDYEASASLLDEARSLVEEFNSDGEINDFIRGTTIYFTDGSKYTLHCSAESIHAVMTMLDMGLGTDESLLHFEHNDEGQDHLIHHHRIAMIEASRLLLDEAIAEENDEMAAWEKAKAEKKSPKQAEEKAKPAPKRAAASKPAKPVAVSKAKKTQAE